MACAGSPVEAGERLHRDGVQGHGHLVCASFGQRRAGHYYGPGDSTIEIYILPANLARRPGARKPLRQERPLKFAKEKFATTVGPTGKQMEVDSDGKEAPGGKKAKFELRAIPARVILKDMPRDGNCLPRCLGNGLTYLKQDEKKRPARLIRAALHAYMARKTDEFAAFWDGRNTADKGSQVFEGLRVAFKTNMYQDQGEPSEVRLYEMYQKVRRDLWRSWYDY